MDNVGLFVGWLVGLFVCLFGLFVCLFVWFVCLCVCCLFVCLYWISCSLLLWRPMRTEHATIAWIAGAI